MTTPETAAADASTRIVDGQKEHRLRTTRGMAFLFRTLVCTEGWHQGAKEWSRARKLAKAIGKQDPPEDKKALEAWGQEPYEFWLPERLRDHGKKCLNFFFDKGALSAAPDDDAVEPFMIDMGISVKDD